MCHNDRHQSPGARIGSAVDDAYATYTGNLPPKQRATVDVNGRQAYRTGATAMADINAGDTIIAHYQALTLLGPDPQNWTTAVIG